MRSANYFFTFLLCAILSFTTKAQSGIDSTGLPGDNFSLQGALQMFQQASSIEEFEKLLNTENNHINNLDLNGDGDIDYVKVIDKSDKDAHAFVLQVPVSENENQDIAVIELEKTGDANAVIQIIGDEDIYGEEVIVEPDSGDGNDEKKTKASGPSYEEFFFDEYPVIVNVWLWPSVRFVYGPVYRPWVSPWRWRHYPTWWRPWRPLRWHAWHPFHRGYHRSFAVVHTHRVIHAHNVYKPFRTSSVSVRSRHSAAVGNYRVTKTRTSVTGPRGNTTTVKKTTVSGPRGNVRGQKTTVKRKRG
jgi:hypothetical protein